MLKLHLNKLKKWLNKPFPFYENYRQKILIPLIFTFLVVIGLIILNPVTDSNLFYKQIKYEFTYGFIILFVILLFTLVIPELFPKFFDIEKWNIKKTIIYFFISVLSVGFCVSVFFYFFDNPNHLAFLPSLYYVLTRAIALSFFPNIITIFYAEKRLHNKNHLQALHIISNLQKSNTLKKTSNNQKTFIFAENTKEEIKISENDLFYIKAEGNYCFIVFKDGKSLIRSSLKSIETIIGKSNQFVRCHKSYIVNLKKVVNVTGNAKGYLFHLENEKYQIPVSRNFSKSLIQSIKNNTLST